MDSVENESRNPEVTDTMINMRLATTMCSYNGAETNNVNQIMRGMGKGFLLFQY